ncbi:MAG: lipid-binding SYLF domain-containing protein [Alphaproteobacteria bacterium]|nr:lipid-binding SYLF domain-containing protein [Alphaproteobacteria bacterium]MCB9928703.1 lipid-binding SYLF domain-containing protein [Alphaproteobacteria bacterium]
MVTRIARFLTLLLLVGSLAPMARAADLITQRELLSDAQFALERIADSPKMADARALAQHAQAIMIFPNLLKGAFFVGGEGGSGVLLARKPDGSWSYPAFYTLGSVSFGLQIGGQSSAAVLLIMNRDALRAIMADQVKLGGDLSAAVGPVGTGIEASSSTEVGTDIYTYSTTKGLFLGASLEGAVLARREDWNAEVYNGETRPEQIVLYGNFSNPIADSLRAEVAAIGSPAPAQPVQPQQVQPQQVQPQPVQPQTTQ